MENQEQIIQELKKNVDLLFAAARSKMNQEERKDYAEKMSKYSDELLAYTTTAVDNLLLCDIRAIFPGLSYNPGPEPWTKNGVEVTLAKDVKESLSTQWTQSRISVETLLISVQQAMSRPRMTPDVFEILYLEKDQGLRYTNTECKSHRWSLYGTPDHMVCSGTGANKIQHLVLVEKATQSLEKIRSEILAYMAIIHMNLRKRGKHDCTVYGLSISNCRLDFYQLDGRGKWSEKCYQPNGTSVTSVQTIINLFATILNNACATALENITPDDHTPSGSLSDGEDSIEFDTNTEKSDWT